MKQSYKGLSNIQKFSIFLSLILITAIVDYHSFSRKTTEIELYDDLNYRLNALKVSIVRLDYFLDMFVVASFERSSVGMIKTEMKKVDANLSEVLDDPRYRVLFKKNDLLSEGRDSILNDWRTVKSEIMRLDDSLPKDEVMLIHNEVDMNTIIVVEKSDRLLNVIGESRRALFSDSKSQALKSALGFILIMFGSGFVLYRRVFSPVKKATRVARRLASGDLNARFRDDGSGLVGKLNLELNDMLKTLTENMTGKEEKNRELRAESAGKTGQIGAVSNLLGLVGRSLSRSEIFNTAVKEAVGGGADAAAIYLVEGDGLRLKSSSGFEGSFLKEVQAVQRGPLRGMEERPVVFRDLDGYPDENYGRTLRYHGFDSLLVAPVLYNNETIGFLFAACKGKKKMIEEGAAFFEAIAAGIGVSAGYIDMFQGEHNSKKFLDRIIRQMPFGVAVFERSGVCIMINDAVKRYIGADYRANLVGKYSIFEDEVFSSQAIMASIKKSYEGYSTEFIINYNPMSVKKYGFSGPMRRLRVKSFPLYDSGGEITDIVLIYEELSSAQNLSQAVPGAGPTQ